LNSQETDPKKGSTFTNFYKNKISIKCCKNTDVNVWCDVDDSKYQEKNNDTDPMLLQM
jgi:hypothetical protein